MNTDLSGKRPVAIVTGGVRRVGLASACALARGGCDIVITYRREPGKAEAARDTVLAAAPGSAVLLKSVSLDEPEETEAGAKMLAETLPRVDVLVHNASVYEPTSLAKVTAADCERLYRVNALAPLLLSRTLAPRLAKSKLPGGGAIVSMCDIHAMGEVGQPRKGFLAYSMSKAALLEMTMVLARELAPKVRCNAVAPGVVAFPESGHESDAEAQAKYLSRVPLERSGTPEEAAEAVAWLALRATYTTGQVVRVDGGRWIT